jgi:sugar-specific transcriptional regulator TrmB
MEARIISAMRGQERTAKQIAQACWLPLPEVYKVLVRLEARGRARLCAVQQSSAKPRSATWGLVGAEA